MKQSPASCIYNFAGTTDSEHLLLAIVKGEIRLGGKQKTAFNLKLKSGALCTGPEETVRVEIFPNDAAQRRPVGYQPTLAKPPEQDEIV